jgi:hypothetical protein
MLGNVVAANMLLGQLFGAATAWMLVTWVWAFVVLSRHATVIRQCPSPGATLHSFLRDSYASRPMQLVAAVITVFAGIGVFAVELLIGMALVLALTSGSEPWLVAGAFGLVTVVAMIATMMTGGLRAIVESDALLWRVAMLATLGLPALVVVSITSTQNNPPMWRDLLFPSTLPPLGVAAFAIGVFLLQVPLLIGDYGTWQRVRATHLDETPHLGRKLLSLGALQGLLWGAPVIAGILLLRSQPIDNGRTGPLYAVAGPLIELARHWVERSGLSPFPLTSVTFLAVVGLTSVMVTTADGYLMIALEAWVRDFRPRPVPQGHAARRARRLALAFGVAATFPVVLLFNAGGTLLGLIATFFGALVALSTPTLLALYHPERARAWAGPVVTATFVGFLITIGFGLGVTFFLPAGTPWDWWRTYGVFLTPVPAMTVPLFTVLYLFATHGEFRNITRFVRSMFSPWPTSGWRPH